MKIKYKILIVEDEAITAMLIQKKLKQFGYNVLKPIASGEEAIRIALKDRPHIILMDILLAGVKNGVNAAREICEVYDVPVIFMTGYPEKDFIELISGVKNYSFIKKPIQIKEIELIINDILSDKNTM